MPDSPNQHHRHSIRLYEYDYALPGAYFVTVGTYSYKCIFGKIRDQVMLLNNLGELVEKCWMDIPDHFPNVEVKPFMVMPNHIHGIITIYKDDGRGTIYRAPTTEKFGRPVIGSVPTIIRTYKASVSRIARRELGMVKIWQRNYYEHIIRNELELKNIACYISINPETWADDPEYQQ